MRHKFFLPTAGAGELVRFDTQPRVDTAADIIDATGMPIAAAHLTADDDGQLADFVYGPDDVVTLYMKTLDSNGAVVRTEPVAAAGEGSQQLRARLRALEAVAGMLLDPPWWMGFASQGAYTSGLQEELTWVDIAERGPSLVAVGAGAKATSQLTFVEDMTISLYVHASFEQSPDASGYVALQIGGTITQDVDSPLSQWSHEFVNKIDPGYHIPDAPWSLPPMRVKAGRNLIVSTLAGFSAGTVADNGTSLQIVRLA